MAKRGRKAHRLILTFNTIVGDASDLVKGNYPHCEKCKQKIKTCVVSLIQYAFDGQRETDVFHCPSCGIYNSYTYDIFTEAE